MILPLSSILRELLNDPFVHRRNASFDSQSLKVHQLQGNNKNVFAWKKRTVETSGARQNEGARTGEGEGRTRSTMQEYTNE